MDFGEKFIWILRVGVCERTKWTFSMGFLGLNHVCWWFLWGFSVFKGYCPMGFLGNYGRFGIFEKWEVHRLDGDSERLFFVFSRVVENQKQFMIVAWHPQVTGEFSPWIHEVTTWYQEKSIPVCQGQCSFMCLMFYWWTSTHLCCGSSLISARRCFVFYIFVPFWLGLIPDFCGFIPHFGW